jgi:hypothetical protein
MARGAILSLTQSIGSIPYNPTAAAISLNSKLL